MEKPDYEGHGIANLMSSVLEAFGAPGQSTSVAPCPALPVERLRDTRHAVLLVIDGLGRAQLEEHAPHGALAGARVADLSSVFPSTTASAVTTFMTGDAPLVHGLTGWHVWLRELGVVGTPLPFRVRGSDVSLSAFAASERVVFERPGLSERLTRRTLLVHPEYLADTHYTRAHALGAERRSFNKFTALVERVCEVAQEREPSFTYVYWPELDSLSHLHGAASPQAGDHLRALDAALEDCSRRLAGSGTLLMVCADHGFVDTRPQTRLLLEHHGALKETLALPLCGEPRAAYCYVKAGAEGDFLAYTREVLGDACQAVDSAELVVRGYFGEGHAHGELLHRIGTHTLLMKGDFSLVDRLASEQRPFTQIGVHGGMSDAELRVPLVLLEA